MSSKSGQKFIGENRKPRVHIEYDVETFGSSRKVELPFVMGVLSDLSGKSETAKADMDVREFEEFDMDNLKGKMAEIAPRAVFQVENTLTGGAPISVDLTFKSMDDFSPAAIAKNVPALAKLLEARTELNDLMTYMDGKQGAQELLDKWLKDPEMLRALAAAKAAESDKPADA